MWRRGLASWVQADQLAELAEACAAYTAEAAPRRQSVSQMAAPPMLGAGMAGRSRASSLSTLPRKKSVAAPPSMPGGVPRDRRQSVDGPPPPAAQ